MRIVYLHMQTHMGTVIITCPNIPHNAPLVVGAGEQVVGGVAEAHGAHLVPVRPERLQHPAAGDVEQHDGRVLVPRHQQLPTRVHAHAGHRRVYGREFRIPWLFNRIYRISMTRKDSEGHFKLR